MNESIKRLNEFVSVSHNEMSEHSQLLIYMYSSCQSVGDYEFASLVLEKIKQQVEFYEENYEIVERENIYTKTYRELIDKEEEHETTIGDPLSE